MRLTKCLWLDDENLRTYVLPPGDCVTLAKVASEGNRIRSCASYCASVHITTQGIGCLAHLVHHIRGPVFPDEVQESVLFLEDDGAFGWVWIHEVGSFASECAASFEGEQDRFVGHCGSM